MKVYLHSGAIDVYPGTNVYICKDEKLTIYRRNPGNRLDLVWLAGYPVANVLKWERDADD